MDLFHVLLFFHIICGSICLISGAVAMFTRKRKGIHTIMGEIYHASYIVIFFTAIIMSIMHWDEFAFLFYIALLSYAFALYGYISRKKRWKNWLFHHIRGMLGSYIGAVTALLINIGDKIPVINDMPRLWLWFLPTIVGSPLIWLVGEKYKKKKKIIQA